MKGYYKVDLKKPQMEVVERKGDGHPDTLADSLAECLSKEYSRYTLKKFGIVLHHNFDKVGLLGGMSEVSFGSGKLIRPIRILLNGRASVLFGDERIPVKELLEKTAYNFMLEKFPSINPETDILIHYNINSASSPGQVYSNSKEIIKHNRKHWFTPRGYEDLPELTNLFSNDTAIACAYAPLTPAEKATLYLEQKLNSPKFKKHGHEWIGTDIKIVTFRINNFFKLTICIPQIAKYVNNLQDYKSNIKTIRKEITDWVVQSLSVENPEMKIEVYINTRDNYQGYELYLTSIGSSIESGDEALVGRGNRINGLITPFRPMSIEGIYGKNPVYHVGKLYNLIAQLSAIEIAECYERYVEVYLLSQSGRDIYDPFGCIVAIDDTMTISKDELFNIIWRNIERIPKFTKDIVYGKIDLLRGYDHLREYVNGLR